MPVAAFIIVVMALLAAALSRISSGTSIAAVQEQVTVQTLYAAESGAQWGMNQLFYSTGASITKTSADNACAGIANHNISFSAPGMNNCNTVVSCQLATDPANTISFYEITSAASCGSDPVRAQRTVQVSAYLE